MAKLIEITGKALAGEWGTDDESGEGIPVLRTTNFTNEGTVDYNNVVTRTIIKKNLEEKYLRAGDIIIEKSGGSDKQPVGRVVYFDGPENTYLFNNFTGLLRVKEQTKWFPKYVFYSLYGNYRRGGTRPFENKTTGLHNLKTDGYVSRYEVAETSFSKQVEISSQLDKLHSIIKMREDEVIKLDDLIRARFVEMFGDLADPACKWEKCKLVDVCVNSDDIKCGPFGTQLGKDEYTEEGVAVWEIPQINSEFRTLPTHFVTEKKAEELDAYSIIPGDIAMSRKGNVGRCAVFPSSFENGIIHSDVLRIRLNEMKALPEFMMRQLHYSGDIQHQIELVSSGAIMAGINVTKLKQILIYLPPMNLQSEFVKFVAQVDKSKAVVQKSLDESQMLFDSLMQKYFG